MSDTPQRANAAQIAQRNLKALKGPRRPRPMGASPQPQQQQPFALPSQQGQQGGLFGGGIQAPSDFNFSASGPSFPQVSFGSSNSFGSNTSSSDNERGGKEEEDARRNPDFHKKKGNSDNDPPLFAPMPQEAQQQLQGYMQNTAQDINNPFIFGHNNDQQISTQPAASNPFAPKPSLQTNDPFSFGSTSTSTQPPSSNIFGVPASQPTQPSSNPFSFGASQPAQSPASSFTFGQSANQTATSQAPSSGFSFTASTPAQPAANPFSFGAQSSAASAPGFSFTASTPAKPEANKFSFGQTSTKPTEAPAAPFTFGSSQPSQTEANKPVASSTPSFTFGSTQPQSPKPTNLFGSSTQQTPAPTVNGLFGSRSQSPAAAPPTAPPASTKNIFGESNGGLFGKSQSTTPAPKNLFGESSNSIFSAPANTAPPISAATTSDLFGPRSQSPVAANLFGNRSESPAAAPTTGKNLFEKSTQPPAPTTNTLFGNRSESPASTPTNNIFGASSQKPATPAASTPSLFDQITPAPEPKAATPSLFDRISKDSNGNAIRQQPSDEKENTQPSNGNVFGNANQASTSTMFGQKPQSTSNLFGGPVQQPTAPSNNSFDHLNQPVNQLDVSSPPKSFMPATTSNSGPLFGTTSQPATSSGPLSNGSNSFSPRKPIDAPSSANQPPPNGMFPTLPSGNTPAASNDLFGKPSPSKSLSQLGGSSDALANSIEPKEVDSTAPRHSLFAPADIPDEVIRPYMPSAFTGLQEKEFMSKYRMRALNKTIQQAFRDIPLGMDPAPVLEYYYQQRNKIIVGGEKWFQPSKRKFFDESEENTNPSKRARQEETVPDEPVASPPEPTQPRGSINGTATSFKPAEPSTTTNGKTTSPLKSRHISPPQVPARLSSPPKSQPHINGSTTPRAPPPFANPPPSASPSKGKRKAEYQITDQDPEGKGAEERRMKQPKLNGSVGSETSNIFKNILDSPSKAPEKKAPGRLETLEKNSNKDAPRANPFASIPVPGSPSKSAPSTASPAPANMFAPKAAASPFKPTVESNGTKPTSNTFSPKPAVLPATTSTTEPIKPPTFAIKPPSFGNGPVNFLAQFGQQAKKDEKDNEEKLMEKAKAEDMDSDDDEAEWEANYKEKRKAELKELEELAKSKRASFVAGKGFTFGEASKASGPAKESSTSTPAKPLFGESTASGTATKSVFDTPPATNSGASIFGSANPSRSSTPGSVLDSHTPGKTPGQLGGIFGYLSNTGSPASGKDDDSDDGADVESDSENKDPTYQPAEAGSETGSGPTTPVEKTGAGIASVKKANALSFGSSTPSLSSGKPLFGQSGPTSVPTSNGLFSSTSTSTTGTGASTPSLFDRISKDSDGNPIRQIPTEEKENTQPSVTNIFGGNNNPFAKGPTSVPAQSAGENQSSSKTLVGADKTWKPDSPIRFGDSAFNGTTTAPAVSVTEATPTKSSNPFGGLFGSSTTPKPAAGVTGSLFGNSTATKAGGSVGFAFGQSSGASSLFPSATTSRDPSPGQTTDGDSAAEGSNDPDGEHHEQIDLTKGGPGEEDEELLHEVRAKAMKFEAKEAGDKTNPWATKGVGPLRVLKHKETKASRILLRADPSGTIVLNKGILAGVNYVATAKTVKLLTASDNGSGLETYLLQVKTPEFAKALAEVLEANKSST